MFALPPQGRVYLASQPVDMRAGHNGLFAIIQKWGLDPFGGDLFAFIGKRGDRANLRRRPFRIKKIVVENRGFRRGPEPLDYLLDLSTPGYVVEFTWRAVGAR